MSDLGSITRPYQTPDYAPPRQYFNGQQPSTAPVIIRAGRGGSGKVLNTSFSFSSSNYMTQYVNEKKSADFGTAF
jgi:hypothetical protein